MKKIITYTFFAVIVLFSTAFPTTTHANPNGKVGYTPNAIVVNEDETITITFTLDEPIIAAEVDPEVVIIFTPNNANLVVNPTSITFTTATWDTPQEVEVTLIEAFTFAENIYSSIDFTAASEAEYYDGYSSSIPITIGNPPTVVNVTPADGGTDVSINPTLVVTLSEAIEENTIRISSSPCHFDDSCARPSGVFNENGTVFTITMPETLRNETEYTFYLDSGVSANGSGIMDNFEWSFTTEAPASQESSATSKRSSRRTFGCKDSIASNYNQFSSHRQELCVYNDSTKALSPKVVEILALLRLLGLLK